MIEVRVNIDVAAPPDVVFPYWAEWSNNPDWQTGMQSCEWTSEPPLRISSTYDQKASFLGRPIVSSFEVVEYEPGTKLRIRTTKSTLPLDITRHCRPGPDGGTSLEVIIRGEPSGITRLFNPLTKRMVERNVRADYQRLKARFDA
ncbi:MAG: hypothetical protein HKN26_05855 [Acidimicrobiales bacterium]|nr:hypothetical protein [Acidimicrobiales bacterium]